MDLGTKSYKKWLILAVAVLMLAGYVLHKGIPFDSELIMIPSSREEISYLEVSDDQFTGSGFKIRFAIYDAELDWIQICFSASKGTSMEETIDLQADIDYLIDGKMLEDRFCAGYETWLRSYANIILKNVGDFAELQLSWNDETITIRK